MLVSDREGKEAGVDRVHAETADHLECDGEERYPMASSRESVRLMFKTVADLTEVDL